VFLRVFVPIDEAIDTACNKGCCQDTAAFVASPAALFVSGLEGCTCARQNGGLECLLHLLLSVP